jgi:hypothetical protein
MVATRKTPAPSNSASPFNGIATMEAINAEVQGLWQYVPVPLSNVAGTANDITADCDVPLDAYKKGQKFTLTPLAVNTGATRLNINGKGLVSLKNRDASAVSAGRLAIGRTEAIEHDGVNLRLMNDAPASANGNYRSIFGYQTGNGIDGQGHAIGWTKYPLNTLILNEIPGLAFDGALSRITAQARTYEFDARAIFYVGRGVLLLWNVTDDQAVPGQFQINAIAGNIITTSCIGKFTLASTKVLELRQYWDQAVAATALGFKVGTVAPALPEQYGFLDLRSSN